MNQTAIRVRGLGKQYSIGAAKRPYKTLRESLSALVRPARPSPKADARDTTLWALKDVSFDVQVGELVGIVGRNGAGKSTLLKILSRITDPTEGIIDINGRVGSLLEVGTGFHPELTGRENIFLNGAILGMKRAEIAAKFDEIVAFAETEKFLDTAVKYYSSGMYTRLAFAVAAHLEPEILIVDEVLAVGDAAFQKKCLGKMGQVARDGRTVLFVSHNTPAVRTLCGSAVWLDRGQIRRQGATTAVLAEYLDAASNSASEQVWEDVATAPGNERARLRAVRILNEDREATAQLELDQHVLIQIEYQSLVPGTQLSVAISLFNQDDAYVLSSPSMTDSDWYLRPHPAGIYRGTCEVPGLLLNNGRYHVTVMVVENGSTIAAQADRAVVFEVLDTGAGRGAYFGAWGGVVRPRLQWRTQALPDVSAD